MEAKQQYEYTVGGEKYQITLLVAGYSNDRVAIQFIDANDGELVTTATVNLVDEEDIAENEVAIKTYSENEGIMSFLLENNIVHEPRRYAITGHCQVPICAIQEHILAQRLKK